MYLLEINVFNMEMIYYYYMDFNGFMLLEMNVFIMYLLEINVFNVDLMDLL